MPLDHGCRLDQYHRVDNLRPNPVEPHPQEPVYGRELRPTGPLSAQHGQLMTHSNQLTFKRGAPAEAKIETTAERIATMGVTVRVTRRNLQPFFRLVEI